MNIVKVETAIASIKKYLASDIVNPYIVAVDNGDEYNCILRELNALATMHASDFCATDDSLPDYDALCNAISAAEYKTVVVGVGESARLSGDLSITGRVSELPLLAKVVILYRGNRQAVEDLCLHDSKIIASRRASFLSADGACDIVNFPSSLNVPAEQGVKALLKKLESGIMSSVFVKTSLHLINIREVETAYNAIQQVEPKFSIVESCLSDSLWEEYLEDDNLDGYDLFHWRSFLKMKMDQPKDIYLGYVIEKSKSYESYKDNIIMALLDFPHNNAHFREMYEARKALLKDAKTSIVAAYAAETKVKGDKRAYYLTDNTLIEKQAIIESLDGADTALSALPNIYPALAEYLHSYAFSGTNEGLFTSYFSEYKWLKLTNRLTNEFLETVLNFALAGNRPYNSLKTRGAILDSLNKANTTLFWIDALGAEYIGYIQKRSKALGLKISVHIARANLPTITSMNSDFYDDWSGNKAKTKKLDEIKHNGELDYNYENIKSPIHLATELEIIDEFLEWAVSQLAGKIAEKVLFVSDHGASRLAVINEQELLWEMGSKGQHSGRCCLSSEADVKSEYAANENGFWVLANYDRFKGGRKASVEVHGGASLEETVIPIIEIELFDNKISLSNITPITTASYKKNAEITLFSSNNLKNVSVMVKGKRYIAEAIGTNRYKAVFPEFRKAGKYIADVLEGDNLIGQVEFEIQLESSKSNDNDWFN